MKITYDAKYDILYIDLIAGEHEVETHHVDEDISVDFDEKGRLAGVEVLGASKRVDLSALLPVRVEA